MSSLRIRSVTLGLDPETLAFERLKPYLGQFCAKASDAFGKSGIEIQTWRLTLPPVEPAASFTRYELGNRVDAFQRLVSEMGIRWLCIPFRCMPGWNRDELKSASLELIRRHPNAFLHFIVAEDARIYWEAAESVADIVLSIASLSSNGFDNFRVGAGAQIRANTPFFPFSYHAGREGFSLAVEIVGLLADLTAQNPDVSIDELRLLWINALKQACCSVAGIARDIERETGWEFKGLDISLAPYPGRERSVARIIENLGPRHAGQGGTLAITAILSDVLKTSIRDSGVQAAGFNGVMFSVLEDELLAEANNARHLTLEKLSCYSTVCGCGIDMVPLSGNTFPEEIASLILDTATLATCLRKPLGVRVLPIPMKEANEMTDFNHDFLVNTRVFSIGSSGFRRKFSATPYWSYHSHGAPT